MALFGKKKQANLRATVKMVEEVIADLGLSPKENELQTESGEPAWGLMKGSAQVFVFLHPGDPEDDFGILQVVSPVVTLPDVSGQLPLLRHLLETNAKEITGAAFGVRGETVVLVAGRRTEDLDHSEVKDMILRLGYYADVYDDALATQFGGRRHSE